MAQSKDHEGIPFILKMSPTLMWLAGLIKLHNYVAIVMVVAPLLTVLLLCSGLRRSVSIRI